MDPRTPVMMHAQAGIPFHYPYAVSYSKPENATTVNSAFSSPRNSTTPSISFASPQLSKNSVSFQPLQNKELSMESIIRLHSKNGTNPKEALETIKNVSMQIRSAATLLFPPNNFVPVATALAYFHRFFAIFSIAFIDPVKIAFACIFLSSKVEELPKSLKEVISICYPFFFKKEKLLEADSEVFRQWILISERILLFGLKYEFSIEHPYSHLISYTSELTKQGNILQVAWNFVNDSMITFLCVLFPPNLIALASIKMASKFIDIPLVLENNITWREKELKDAKIKIIKNMLCEIYPDQISNKLLGSDEDVEKERATPHPRKHLQKEISRSHEKKKRDHTKEIRREKQHEKEYETFRERSPSHLYRLRENREKGNQRYYQQSERSKYYNGERTQNSDWKYRQEDRKIEQSERYSNHHKLQKRYTRQLSSSSSSSPPTSSTYNYASNSKKRHSLNFSRDDRNGPRNRTNFQGDSKRR